MTDPIPLYGNTKVTREDWLNVALDLLVSEGVGEVKVFTGISKAAKTCLQHCWKIGNRPTPRC